MAAILHLAVMLDCESKNGTTAYMDVLYIHILTYIYDLIMFAFHPNKRKTEYICENGDCIDLAAILDIQKELRRVLKDYYT